MSRVTDMNAPFSGNTTVYYKPLLDETRRPQVCMKVDGRVGGFWLVRKQPTYKDLCTCSALYVSC